MASTSPPSAVEEKKVSEYVDVDAAAVQTPNGWSAWFGGPNVTIGPRIGPVISSVSTDSDTDESSNAILGKQIALEEGHAIQYRTCSWQKV